MKAEELLEGIQRRTKRSLPKVIRYQHLFFPLDKGWSKQQVLYSMEERITESVHEKDSFWHSFIEKKFHPNDIADNDMEEFVLDWDYASDIESNDRMYGAQEEALETLAKTLLKV